MMTRTQKNVSKFFLSWLSFLGNLLPHQDNTTTPFIGSHEEVIFMTKYNVSTVKPILFQLNPTISKTGTTIVMDCSLFIHWQHPSLVAVRGTVHDRIVTTWNWHHSSSTLPHQELGWQHPSLVAVSMCSWQNIMLLQWNWHHSGSIIVPHSPPNTCLMITITTGKLVNIPKTTTLKEW